MKIRTDEDVRNNLMLSMGSMVFGFAIMMLGFDNIGYGWIFAGVILTLGALYNATKPKENFIEDERSARNKEKAGYHAFSTMIILIITFNLLDIYKIWMLSSSQIYALLFFVGIYIWLGLQWMYNKKGE
ncbi:MAG: DUF2178 domain-containing protein [Candidatus Aenigmarchaeota archaeon]|nr:DUF2178 domain-containing protein [Candidatus Aenigmarchaeota archaeon]